MNELPKGTLLQSGKYTIESVIGSGGFGITYLAWHNVLGHHYAIKEFFINGYCIRNSSQNTILLQGMDEAVYDKYRRKFIEEAQILASLDHPNIVKVVDIFQEHNTAYLVMPFLNGQTLQQKVESRQRLKYDDAVNYIAQISEAVDYIHKKNILHRDIKPDNIIILPDNRAILIDFGSAREFIQNKTLAHTSMLTVGYSPLEQYSSSTKKGPYSDIYSLGATFYFALTGVKPIDAAARTTEAMPEPKVYVSSIPERANRTIMKAMEQKPEMRYQRIKDFMNDLLKKNYSTPSPGKNDRNKGNTKRNVFIILGIVAVLVLSLLIPKIIDLLGYAESRSGEAITTTTAVPAATAPPAVVESKLVRTLTPEETSRLDSAKYRAYTFYNNAVQLGDTSLYGFAREQCNKALLIKPDDSEMLSLKEKLK